MNALSVEELTRRLIKVCDNIIEAEPILSQADRDLGDGDHGIGMKRGMEAAKEALAAGGFETVDKVFITVGKSMMASMGGASGAIFGTLFRAGGKAIGKKETLDAENYGIFVREGLAGVQARGKAAPGDKTCVDALHGAAEAMFGKTDLSEALNAASSGAADGVEKTKEMIATFGRAKTLGEKAIGYPDAGAISISIILKTIAEA